MTMNDGKAWALAHQGESWDVLDHGFVRLVDTMGDDAAVVQAARVSLGSGAKSVRSDERLIHYLMEHRHTSPFEMCEVKLHVKAPIFVARQWMRHRTQSYNEQSARYSILEDGAYIMPEHWIRGQSGTNKQASGGPIELEHAYEAREVMWHAHNHAEAAYRAMLDRGVARETARGVLPVATWTQWYAKVDLHNLLGFLVSRQSVHAQPEIRAYADRIAWIVSQWCPVTYAAWVEHVRDAVTIPASRAAELRARGVL